MKIEVKLYKKSVEFISNFLSDDDKKYVKVIDQEPLDVLYLQKSLLKLEEIHPQRRQINDRNEILMDALIGTFSRDPLVLLKKNEVKSKDKIKEIYISSFVDNMHKIKDGNYMLKTEELEEDETFFKLTKCDISNVLKETLDKKNKILNKKDFDLKVNEIYELAEEKFEMNWYAEIEAFIEANFF